MGQVVQSLQAAVRTLAFMLDIIKNNIISSYKAVGEQDMTQDLFDPSFYLLSVENRLYEGKDRSQERNGGQNLKWSELEYILKVEISG